MRVQMRDYPKYIVLWHDNLLGPRRAYTENKKSAKELVKSNRDKSDLHSFRIYKLLEDIIP